MDEPINNNTHIDSPLPGNGKSVVISKNKRSFSIAIAVMSVLFLLLGGIWGYFYFLAFNTPPLDVRVTNVSSRSFSISWVTTQPSKGTVVVVEKGQRSNYLISNLTKKNVSYDDRDVQNARLQGAKEFDYSVSMSDYEVNVLGEYYVHHITVSNLEPEKEYTFIVGNGFRGWSNMSSDKSENDIFPLNVEFVAKTISERESIVAPDPIYGYVESNNNDDKIVDDAVVFMYVQTGEGRQSQVLSAPLNEYGNWYLDLSNARWIDDNMPVSELSEKTDYEIIFVEAGKNGKSTVAQNSLAQDAPVPTIVISKDLESDEESKSPFVLGVLAQCTSCSSSCTTNCQGCNTTCTGGADAGKPCPWGCGFMEHCCTGGTFTPGVDDVETPPVAQEPPGGTTPSGSSCTGGAYNSSPVPGHWPINDGSGCPSADTCPCVNRSCPNVTCSAGTSADQCRCPAAPSCGNGICEGNEASTCPQDCGGAVPSCGNGVCEAGEQPNGSNPCPQDCCGNGVCESGEESTCPRDCDRIDETGDCAYHGGAVGETKGCCPGQGLFNKGGYCCYAHEIWNGSACAANDNCGRPGELACQPRNIFDSPCDPGLEVDANNQGRCCGTGQYWNGSACVPEMENGWTTCNAENEGVGCPGGRTCNCYKVFGITRCSCGLIAILAGDEICDDLDDDGDPIDNDRDGKANCEDPSCFSHPHCAGRSFLFEGLQKFIPAVSAEEEEKYTISADGVVFAPNEDGLYSIYIPGKGKAVDVQLDADVTYMFYIDNNGNGVAEEDEIIVLDRSVDITVAKESSIFTYELSPGYNFISFPFLPDNINSHDLLAEMNESSSNGSITLLARYYSDFEVSSYRSDLENPISGQSFTVIPGWGYVVRSFETTTIKINGKAVTKPVGIDFPVSGWYLIGIHGAETSYTAKSLIDGINAVDGFSADNVTEWQKSQSRYNGLTKVTNDGRESVYGFDFPINDRIGYFVRITEGNGVWTPK